jgi:hypothetical protein
MQTFKHSKDLIRELGFDSDAIIVHGEHEPTVALIG